MSALTVFAVTGTLACLAALATAIVAYLRQPAAQPIAGQRSSRHPYSDHEIQEHAHVLIAQIERYLRR